MGAHPHQMSPWGAGEGEWRRSKAASQASGLCRGMGDSGVLWVGDTAGAADLWGGGSDEFEPEVCAGTSDSSGTRQAPEGMWTGSMD